LIGRLALLRGDQIHPLRLLVQRLRQLAVDFKLRHDIRRQVFAVFRQQFGAFQRFLRLALALAVELIAQRLQIGVELLALLSAPARIATATAPGGYWRKAGPDPAHRPALSAARIPPADQDFAPVPAAYCWFARRPGAQPH
jgi:hypothetical protein